MYPCQFLVYRPTTEQYYFYSFVYDKGGNIIKIKCQPAFPYPGRIISYEEPTIHVVGIKRDNHIKFYDFYETGVYQVSFSQQIGDGGYQNYEASIPVVRPETMAVMPQELSCEAALLCYQP